MKVQYLKIYHITLLFVGSLLMFGGCKKFIDVAPPSTSLVGSNVFTTDVTAISALNGIYTTIGIGPLTGTDLESTSLYPSLSSDELLVYPGTLGSIADYSANSLTASGDQSTSFWSDYQQIFNVNSAISGLTSSRSLTPAIKQQLLGEALFMRALYYFYLVNLYGDVPLVLNTDYKVNSLLPRTAKIEVYRQIIADLNQAKSLLSERFLDATLLSQTSERVRPTTWAAQALLARVYLYYGNLNNNDVSSFKKSETQADSLINSNGLFTLTTLDNTFVKNNNESIWALQPVNSATYNTPEGFFYILPPSGPTTGNVYLSNSLLNSFEIGDQRKVKWIDTVSLGSDTYHYPFKYKVAVDPNGVDVSSIQEYDIVFRLAEQYLIRSEAKVYLGDPTAVKDLDIIRKRAGLPDYSGPTDKTSLITAILHERQVEFFTEWGHRWLDLKRTNTADVVMPQACIEKGTVWNTNQQLYPIPLIEIQHNPKLKQNPGY